MTGQEADAHILVDGSRVEPTRLPEMRLAFILPVGGEKAVLRSNVFIPAQTVAESADPRELGLCVRRLQIDGEVIALVDDRICGSGWHEAECALGRFSHRWRSGYTPLPAGARTVIVDLAGVGYYWRDPRRELLPNQANASQAIDFNGGRYRD